METYGKICKHMEKYANIWKNTTEYLTNNIILYSCYTLAVSKNELYTLEMTIFIKKIMMTSREFRAHDGPQGINPDILATSATGDWSIRFGLSISLYHSMWMFQASKVQDFSDHSLFVKLDPPHGPILWCPKKCQSEKHPAAHFFMAKILSFFRPLPGLPSTDTIWPSDTMWLSWCKKSHGTLVTDRNGTPRPGFGSFKWKIPPFKMVKMWLIYC